MFALSGGAEKPKQLVASCGGQGLMLGPVTDFTAQTNDALQSTLVDVRRGSERRLLLLTIRDDGTPAVQDLAGQIAMSAGRGPTQDIAGLDIDVREFAQAGTIGVAGNVERRAGGAQLRIDLGQQISATRALRSARAEK